MVKDELPHCTGFDQHFSQSYANRMPPIDQNNCNTDGTLPPSVGESLGQNTEIIKKTIITLSEKTDLSNYVSYVLQLLLYIISFIYV